MKYTNDTLAAMSLKELAALVNKPSLMKYSKAKAVEYVIKHLSAVGYVIKHLPAKAAPVAKVAKTKAVKTDKKEDKVSKHDFLQYAMEVKGGATREELMSASGFDTKNLSVAMCNLKNKGYIIAIAVDKEGVRKYSIK